MAPKGKGKGKVGGGRVDIHSGKIHFGGTHGEPSDIAPPPWTGTMIESAPCLRFRGLFRSSSSR